MKNFTNIVFLVAVIMGATGFVFSPSIVDGTLTINQVTVEAFGSGSGGGDGGSDGTGEGPGENPGGFGSGSGGGCGGCDTPDGGGETPDPDPDPDPGCGGDCGGGETPQPSCDAFSASPNSFNNGTGGNVTLSWATTNVTSVTIDQGVGSVPVDGSKTVVVNSSKTFTLTATGAGGTVTCTAPVTVTQPTPSCDAFTATPQSFNNGVGGNVTLAWNTTNVDSVTIDQGVGTFNQGDGNTTVNVTASKTFTLTATGVGGSDTCSVSVTVTETNGPSCDSFTASPNTLPTGGGNVTLTWETTNADSVEIDQGIGAVSADGSRVESVADSITYTMTVKKAGFADVTCSAPVTVGQSSFSCEANVNFSVSSSKVDVNEQVTLTWSTTGATSVSISPDIGATSLNGSQNVTIDQNVTYTLTASNGTDTIHCPVSVSINTGGGGGGGGGRSPRCEFDASDTKITAGEEVTLSWETRDGREIWLYEGDYGDERIFTTDDEDEVEEGSIRVRPTEDTTYTLVVKRGSRDRKCDVDIEVEDHVVITSVRTPGQVAGISLTQVPYTGFEAGPMLTSIFYILLTIWALFVAYVLVIKEDKILGFSLAGAFTHNRVYRNGTTTEGTETDTDISKAEAYVNSATTPTRDTAAHTATAPSNLPIGIPTVVGYANQVVETETDVTSDTELDREMKELEDRAHEQRVLLSSDAMRHFIKVAPQQAERLLQLDALILEAKITFPIEDGWLVLNLERMTQLCERRGEAVTKTDNAMVADTDVTGFGSLAEAIVLGNVGAAYQMIGNRPMIALADAAADLDALYRARKGEKTNVSKLLLAETEHIATDKIEGVIAALTSAIDGTYTDEASAVKVAVMKAIKALNA